MHTRTHSFTVKNESGFTLVEILVSLVILLILVVAFVPMFTFVAQAVSNNNAKDTATALANSRIEYLRTLPFVVKDVDGEIKTDPNVPQLGFIGGNPPGSIPASDAIQTKNVNGKEYIVKTDISWDESGKFKKVSISVEYPSAFGSGAKVINKFYTLAAEEGELDLPAAGNIRVQIYDKSGYPFTSTDLLVKIVSNDGSEQQNYTENGEKLFGILEAGYYTVYAQVPEELSFRPDQTILDGWLVLTNIQVADNNTVNAPFYIDLPGEMNLKMEDDDSAIVGNGTLHVSWADGTSTKGFSPMNFSASDFSNEELLASTIKNQLGNLWPGGSYFIKLTDVLDNTSLRAYDVYDMSVANTLKPKLINGSDWNGSFDTAGSSIQISVELDSLLKTHLDAALGVTTEPYTYTDASTSQTVTLNKIVSWEDQSGNDCDATPSNGNPIVVDNVVNDLPAIKFTRSLKQVLRMNIPDIPSDSRPSDDFTIFIVAKPMDVHPIDQLGERYGGVTDTAAQSYLLYPDHGGVYNVGQGLSLGSNGLSNYEHGDSYLPPTAIYTGNLNDFNILGVRYQDKYPNLIINGSTIGNTWVPNTTWHPRQHIYAPKFIGGGSYGYYEGYVAEILIYDCSLSDDNIEFISNSLKNKYGL